MRLPNRPARLNRSLLLLLGVLLLAGGAFELATRFGLLHLVPKNQSLAPITGRPPTWGYDVAVAAAILIGLADLRWLAAQVMRRPPTRRWQIGGDPSRGVTVLHADTATAPLVRDVESYPGVRSATGWLTGPRLAPLLRLRVWTEYDADLVALRQRIQTHALPRLCAALELDDLPTALHLTPTSGTTRAR